MYFMVIVLFGFDMAFQARKNAIASFGSFCFTWFIFYYFVMDKYVIDIFFFYFVN